MDEAVYVEKLVEQIRSYAESRARDVSRGAETPRLAGLLVQKYGRGVADAVAKPPYSTVRELLIRYI